MKIITRLCTLFIVCLFSLEACQKAMPQPSSNPAVSDPSNNSISPPIFEASINGSPTIAFQPEETISGSNTSLIGTLGTLGPYTVTLTFPSTTGPGSFFFGSGGFSASINDAGTFYYANATYGTGSITINSVVNGRYSGTFSFIGSNSSSNTESANGGTFTNL